MQLHWINHAGFLLQDREIGLLCDPWIDGYVFQNSWALISPTKFSYHDFSRVTHIWFSHEHPDHFFPPNLKKIPPEIRQRITVLFQATTDKRVVNVCRGLGFRSVLELPVDWHCLSDDLSVLCHPVPRGDSWLAIKANGKSILNINDCVYMSKEELRQVRRAVGSIDVLVTQFSYASWWGNRDEAPAWQKAAQEMLEKMAREVDVLRPPQVILAASFVFFCHEENTYMNEHINRVDRAYRFLQDSGHTRPLVLYPGDQWTVGEPWDSTSALRQYEVDYEGRLQDPVKVRSQTVDVAQLVHAATKFAAALRQHNSQILLRRLRSTTIHLTDHKISLKLGRNGFKQVRALSYEDHDVALSSEALLYCLTFPWGGETLMINGRFQAPARGNHHRFFSWCSVAQANNRCICYDGEYYKLKLRRRVVKLLGLGQSRVASQ